MWSIVVGACVTGRMGYFVVVRFRVTWKEAGTAAAAVAMAAVMLTYTSRRVSALSISIGLCGNHGISGSDGNCCVRAVNACSSRAKGEVVDWRGYAETLAPVSWRLENFGSSVHVIMGSVAMMQ